MTTAYSRPRYNRVPIPVLNDNGKVWQNLGLIQQGIPWPAFTVDVRDFGAKGDGKTDDTTAIQSALTAAANAGGGIVYMPPGTYLVSTVSVGAKVWLRGAGMGATAFTKTGAATGATTWTVRLTGNAARLSDCTVSAADTTASGGASVGITNGASYCRVQDVEVTQCNLGVNVGGLAGNATYSWDNCNYNVVSGVYAHDVGSLTVGFYAPVSATGNVAIGCTGTNVGLSAGSGFELRNQIDGKLIGCVADACQIGFDIEEASTGCLVLGCTSRSAVKEGFIAIGTVSTTGASGETRDSAFIGCVSSADAKGFVVQNANRITCSGCEATASTGTGFLVTGSAGPTSLSDDCLLTDCVASACGADGFSVVNGYGARTRITGRAVNNTSTGVLVGGTARNNGMIDVQASGNGTDMGVSNGTWEVRQPTPVLTGLNGTGATVSVVSTAGSTVRVRVTDATAFTINGPSSPTAGATLVFEVENASGGAMGAITWNGVYHLAGAFTNPANTKVRTITFRYDEVNAAWRETSRSAADQSV